MHPAVGRMLVAMASGGAMILIALVADVTGTPPGHPWVFGLATILVMSLALAIYDRRRRRFD